VPDRERSLLDSLASSSLFRRPGERTSAGTGAAAGAPTFVLFVHAVAFYRSMIVDSLASAGRDSASKALWARSGSEEVQSPTYRGDVSASSPSSPSHAGQHSSEALRKARAVLLAADLTCKELEGAAGSAALRTLEST
jgi:hypothetical protein